MQITFSNRVEVLYEALKRDLFQKGAPFVRRLVVVPSPAMKSWLTLRMADDPDLQVSAGLEVVYLDESMERLLALNGEHKRVPKSLELGLSIEAAIKTILQEEQEPLWEPLRRYLGAYPELKRKGEKRLVALSDTLAHLFQEYGLYGGAMLEEWEQSPPDHWQGALWRRLYQKQAEWSTPHHLLQTFPEGAHPQLQVHLFAISYLAPLHFDFLLRLSSQTPVWDYLLSPCMAFWSDQLTDRQQVYLQKKWERGAPTESFEELFQDRHPLLANLGRLGRERAAMIEDHDLMTEELYQFEEIPKTLLHHLQGDMGQLLRIEGDAKVNCQEEIATIQFHNAPTKMREVEGLYDTLMRLIEHHREDEDPIQPNDIVVMSPDIMGDAPFIQAVFGREESVLDYQLMDLSSPAHNEAVRTFLHLLHLPQRRWELPALLTLMQASAFQEKLGLSEADVEQWKEWMLASGIRWGFDSKHRQELLQRDHCNSAMANGEGFGTWSIGLQQLLLSLVREGGTLEMSDSELLSKGVELIQNLYRDLKPLETNAAMSLHQWIQYLSCLVETYVEDPENCIGLVLKGFHRLPEALQEEIIPFSSILPRLEALFARQHVSYREGHLHAVRFCAFLPMRAIPAKVIVLMGMDEEAFPRKDPTLSLNLLKPGLSPQLRDYDRFLFLEALLSARHYFIVSYLGTASDGKEQAPSIVISELMQQLDRDDLFHGERPSAKCSMTHPFHPFDAKLFQEESVLKSYSQQQYRAACVYYHRPKQETSPLLLPSTLTIVAPKEHVEVISLKELSQMARNPIQAFFNHTLGIWLQPEEARVIPEEEALMLSPLDKAILKKRLLKEPVEVVLDQAEKSGLIVPKGPFYQVEKERLLTEMQALQEQVWKLAGAPEEYFKIAFHEKVREPHRDVAGNWHLPPLEVIVNENARVRIVGEIDNISSQGMVSWHKNDRKEVIKGWPQYLVFCALIKEYGLPTEEGWIMGKSGTIKSPLKGDLEQMLATFLDYHKRALLKPSPLLPEWVGALVEKDPIAFQKEMQKSLSSQSQYFYNHYMQWLGRKGIPHSWLSSMWKNEADLLYSEMYAEWFPKRGGSE